MLGNARSIVLHPKHGPARFGPRPDMDRALRPFDGVLGEVAQDLGQILRVHPDADLARDVDRPAEILAARRPPQHADDPIGDGPNGLRGTAARTDAGPCSRQLVLDMSSHAVGHGRDLLGDPRFATRPQFFCIRAQDGEGRLQSVREIGRPRPRARDRRLLRLEKTVDLGRERSHLVRKRRSETRLTARQNRGEPTPHRIERLQAHRDLHPRGQDQKRGEEAERGHEVARECQDGRTDLRPVDRDRRPDRSAAQIRR